MQFERRSIQIKVRGNTIELFELSAGDMLRMDENTDMSVFLEACMEGVTAEAIKGWPLAVASEIYAAASELNGLDSDAGN